MNAQAEPDWDALLEYFHQLFRFKLEYMRIMRLPRRLKTLALERFLERFRAWYFSFFGRYCSKGRRRRRKSRKPACSLELADPWEDDVPDLLGFSQIRGGGGDEKLAKKGDGEVGKPEVPVKSQKQPQLGRFFGWDKHRSTPAEEQRELALAKASLKRKAELEELEMHKKAKADSKGEIFAKIGPRDKLGNQRVNVGGRPPKSLEEKIWGDWRYEF